MPFLNFKITRNMEEWQNILCREIKIIKRQILESSLLQIMICFFKCFYIYIAKEIIRQVLGEQFSFANFHKFARSLVLLDPLFWQHFVIILL